MKTVIRGALALALLASTAGVALAQENDHDRWHDASDHPRPMPRPQPEQRGAQPVQAEQPRSPQAQPSAPAQDRRSWQGGQSQAGPGGWRRDESGRNYRGGPVNPVNPAQPAPRADPTPPQPQPGGDRRWDRDGDRRGQPDMDRRRDDNRTWDRDRDGRRDADRNRDWDRRNDRDWDRRNDRDWDRNRERPRYDPGRWPRAFHSEQRYRSYAYRPPSGFFVRNWVYGDILPRSWWAPDYRLLDWWSFGLPMPPAGFEWVRVGDDALLVDMFTGRVVEVAYDLFW